MGNERILVEEVLRLRADDAAHERAVPGGRQAEDRLEAPEELGRDIPYRAGRAGAIGGCMECLGSVAATRKAEVGHHNPSVSSLTDQHDIAWLEIAVNNILFVGGPKRVRHLLNQRKSLLGRHPAGAREPLGQSLAFEEFHGEEALPLAHHELVQRDEIGVRDAGERTKLGLQAVELIGTQVVQGLEGDVVAELAELVAGSRRGRERPDQVTLFKSVGFALEDLATATLAYDRARARSIGLEVTL